MRLESAVLLALLSTPAMAADSLSGVSLTLRTDRGSYWAGEPMVLTMAVRNETSERIWGFFHLGQEETQVEIRRGAGPFETVAFSRSVHEVFPHIDVARAPSTLDPGQSRDFRDVLTMNVRTRDLLLDAPGDYEVKVRCWPYLGRPNAPSLETNTVRIRVDAPPSGQAAALSEFRRNGLALLVQSPMGYSDHEPAVVERAIAFIDRHIHGPYADHVRAALLEALRHRVNGNRATTNERTVYERLKAELTREP